MKLKMLRLFDDAWGVGIIVGGASGGEMGKQGVVPLVSSSFLLLVRREAEIVGMRIGRNQFRIVSFWVCK
jgi:hypothetical protein